MIFETLQEAEQYCRENFYYDVNDVVLGSYWVVKGYVTQTEDGKFLVEGK